MPRKTNAGKSAGDGHAENERAADNGTGSMPAADDQPLFHLQGGDSELRSRVHSDAIKLHPKGSLAPARERAGAALPEPIAVNADDLIEIELTDPDGRPCAIWMRGDEYRDTVAKRVSRGEASADGVLTVPDALDLAPRRGVSRGVGRWVIKALHVLGIDLANETAKAIATRLDQRTSDTRPRFGLCRCCLETNGFALGDASPVTDDAPILVLLHGTMSSTWGSFGDLWSTERATELAELRHAYGDRVYAFEHATLTESPIANAVALARALNDLRPGGGRIHLLSHSRGGLIGELLCRGNAAGPSPETIAKLFGDDRAAVVDLRQLDTLLANIMIERFVRVACPALGTTLASGRLDRWLSVVGTACSLLPLSGATPIGSFFDAIGDFLAAVIKERTDPQTLPGLAAMMPDSPLIALLNFPGAQIAGELTVIAGDVEFATPWGRVLEWMADRFYASGHDLVVNTPSMSGGALRREPARISLHRTSRATHFNYFANADSAAKIARALTRESEDVAGFELLVKPSQPIARGDLRGRPDQQPTVFVLPGIMGSELAVGADKVWIDKFDLVFGGVAKLAIDNSGVIPTSPLREYYGDLIRQLARSHNVEPFAFDWRLPMEDEADRLADAVGRVLREAEPNKQPIRLLAHSMGGLVARTMIARHAELWRKVTSLPQSRLVMLGTPNGGSHAINELLIGRSETLGQLQRIDITHNMRELLEIVCRFPGVLGMLPKDSGEDYFDQLTWHGYRARDREGEDWVVPAAGDLARAKALRTLLDETPPDPKNVLYLAGQAQQTVCGMRMASSGDRIELIATDRGDGRVTWDSGIPASVNCWFLPGVEHGDLAREPDGFAAIEDLLATGTTSRLLKTPPVSRSQEETVALAPRRDTLYPTADSLAASALGATLRPPRAKPERQMFNVRMVHGHLSCARYALLVGHYLGDPLVSAEGELNRELDGALSRRLRLGAYPGQLNEFAFVPHRQPSSGQSSGGQPGNGAVQNQGALKGGLIVGLGEAGALTQGSLTETVSRALIEWLLTRCIEPTETGAAADDAPTAWGISSLLIGTGTGGIPITDSVQALLRAVARANRAMAAADHPAKITELEFVELYQDQMIRAVKAIKRIPSDIDEQARFAFDAEIRCDASGLRRPYVEEPAGWWQRLNVSAHETRDSPGEKTLRFSMTGRRARAEVQQLLTQRRLVDRFIEQSVGTTTTDTPFSRTLFELLFPNELKDQAPDAQDLILVVDEEAARYPWELLEDPRDKDRKPIVYRRGILRQLEASRYRYAIQSTPARTALVVGDPVGPFTPLPGAQQEAQTVAAILETSLTHVELLDRPKAEEVINALFKQSYQILHLAGHGVYKYPLNKLTKTPATWRPLPGEATETATGMVIGDHMVLSPKEVHQMRDVPELVFINCCHLGTIKPEQTQQSPLIAANLATEFIAMGVRAVIAAGWAVDDAAANTFARVFYEAMLSGEYFGAAVSRARRATFDQHPNVNTWGAYQCYGDPQYRLLRDHATGSDAPDRSAAAERGFDSHEEIIAALDAIAARMRRSKDGVSGDGITRIVDAMKKSHAVWLERGDVLAAVARAWKAAGDSKAATSYFRRALATKSEALTLGDIQIGLQLATEGNANSLNAALLDLVGDAATAKPPKS
jgi:Uncharacterized protein conserved in bacteria